MFTPPDLKYRLPGVCGFVFLRLLITNMIMIIKIITPPVPEIAAIAISLLLFAGIDDVDIREEDDVDDGEEDVVDLFCDVNFLYLGVSILKVSKLS